MNMLFQGGYDFEIELIDFFAKEKLRLRNTREVCVKVSKQSRSWHTFVGYP